MIFDHFGDLQRPPFPALATTSTLGVDYFAFLNFSAAADRAALASQSKVAVAMDSWDAKGLGPTGWW